MNLTGKIKAFTDEQKVSEKLTKQQLRRLKLFLVMKLVCCNFILHAWN